MCEYCEDRKPLSSLNSNDNPVIKKGGAFWWIATRQFCTEIHFCPMCGKKLEASNDTKPS